MPLVHGLFRHPLSRRLGLGTRSAAAVGAALAALGATISWTPSAQAQQQTFHLDRLEVPGAPDDGLILFRPYQQSPPTFYAQLGVGFAYAPFRMSNITNNPGWLHASASAGQSNLIVSQISTYLSAGFEVFGRLTIGATFPSAWVESGNQPPPAFTTAFNGGATPPSYSTTGPALGDTRLDVRYTIVRGTDGGFGAQLGIFLPTGAGSSTNFGGDGPQVEFLPMLTGDATVHVGKFPLIFVGNVGYMFRHDNSLNGGGTTQTGGLGIGNEIRLALGALMPIDNDRYRLGLSFMGQTGGIEDSTTGKTIFTDQNTPVEWQLEGRMKIGKIDASEWYAGVGAGTRITDGYGAPDFRGIAFVGMYVPIVDTEPKSPDRDKIRMSIHESMKDTDGDGIPDDVDACPEVPEDHKPPDPMDGCPAPADRDGDGIPDQYDKCPDQPEDKDGIDDQDGCPEDDADHDGILDTKDACPKEPGQPDPDPKKNGCPKFIHLEGSQVRILQQVHFQTASATILADSFPMLQEIVALLKANPDIRRMRIEGHTDNHGAAEMNLDLSKRRAASVRSWLVEHGVESGRLESEGYGLTQPIATNDTDEGRALNRRVEFKIVEQGGGP